MVCINPLLMSLWLSNSNNAFIWLISGSSDLNDQSNVVISFLFSFGICELFSWQCLSMDQSSSKDLLIWPIRSVASSRFGTFTFPEDNLLKYPNFLVENVMTFQTKFVKQSILKSTNKPRFGFNILLKSCPRMGAYNWENRVMFLQVLNPNITACFKY